MTKIANFDTGDIRQSGGLTVGSGAGGDLSGGYPAPTVVGIGGIPLSGATPNDDDVLTYDSGAGTWGPEPGGAIGSFLLADLGGQGILKTVAASGATETLDLADGSTFDVTLTADCTFTFTGAVNGVDCSFSVLVRQDGTGGWDAIWPGSVVWQGGTEPTIGVDPGDATLVAFLSVDGGTVWFGVPGAAAALTPATTVTDETTWGITPAVGSDTEYARQDHTHGSPAQPTGGEILITDTPAGSPLIFADLLQNESGTDLLYTG